MKCSFILLYKAVTVEPIWFSFTVNILFGPRKFLIFSGDVISTLSIKIHPPKNIFLLVLLKFKLKMGMDLDISDPGGF